MRAVTVYGSGKYFNAVQTIELQVTFGADPFVKVVGIEGDVATVHARALGTESWCKLAGDTLEALGRWCVENQGDIPSEAMFDAWHEATAIVWKRALTNIKRLA